MFDKNKILLNTKIISIDKSPYPDRKKGLLFIHDFDFNDNELKIPKELAEKHLDSLNGSPLVAKYDSNMNDLKGHEPVIENDKIVGLNTSAVGFLYNAHIDTYKIDDVDVYGVWAEAYLWLRFQNTLAVVEEIFNENGKVNVSVEVSVGGYDFEGDSNKRTATRYLNYFGTALLGSRHSPAYADAGLYALNNTEVASAYEQDLFSSQIEKVNMNNILKDGGVTVLLSYDEIKEQLRLLLNPKSETEDYSYDYYSWDMTVYDGYCVARKREDGRLYRFDYSIEGLSVKLVGEPREQIIQYVDVPAGETVEISELYLKFKEKETEVEELNQVIEAKAVELSDVIKEKEMLQVKVEEFATQGNGEGDSKVDNKVDGEVDDKVEALINLNNTISALQEEIKSLLPVKEAYEKLQLEKEAQELAEKQESLKQYALNSKVIQSNELVENEEIAKMIEELNEVAMKSLIADRIVEKAKIEINSSEEEGTQGDNSVKVSAKKSEDLIPQSIEEKYGLSF